MAAPAETVSPQLDQSFDWEFAESQFGAVPVAAQQPEITLSNYQLVDDIPQLAAGRNLIRQAAREVLKRRSAEATTNEEFAASLLPIDALSTADDVIDNRKKHGARSTEYLESWRGLLLDCQRYVGEWYRKKKPEYFEPVRHSFDSDIEDFLSHGRPISPMTENAIIPLKDNEEEESRRINEHVEEGTPRLVRNLGAFALGKSIRTISECTQKAITDFAEDQANGVSHRGYNGYVPEIEKLMIRDIKLDETSLDRFEEQIGLPGIYITHDIIKETLARRGANVEHMDKTELHGAQLLVTDDLMEFAKELDAVASEQWCVEIFMGEVVAKGTPKNYQTFRDDALRRQKSLEGITEAVALFVLDLAETNTDRKKAPSLVEDYVKHQLAELGKKSFSVAEQMFDTKTAFRLQKVALLEAQGRFEAAAELMNETVKAAPGGGACGAGSCGLESVGLTDPEGLKAITLGLTDGKLLHNKELPCPKCHKKKIFYDTKNKACVGCGFRKINGKIIEGNHHDLGKEKERKAVEKEIAHEVDAAYEAAGVKPSEKVLVG